MKLTRHNGRAGKNGVYNPKHNDRSFDIANSEHIDEERAKQNLYWDCYNGFRNFKNPEKENELSATFEDVEQLFYRQRYRDFVTGQNERNVKNRHPERNKETGDLLKSKKTCPEETVYQIGTLDAVKRLDGVIARITNAMKSTIQKIQTTLMKPEVKKAGTEQIKKKAKNSIIEQLSRKKKEIAEREVSRTDQAKSKKQDMEL